MAQSPIELYQSDALSLRFATDLLEIRYPGGKFPGKFDTKKGHTNFVFDPPTGAGAFPEVYFRKKVYQLAKIHLHRGPEHVVGELKKGENPPQFEIHLIHVPKDGGDYPSPLVVIGILYSVKDACETNKGMQCLCQDNDIDPLEFFPVENDKPHITDWYHYEGSLTSFPFSENVSWFVMDKRGDVTAQEVDELTKRASQHAREIQPLARRLVVRSF